MTISILPAILPGGVATAEAAGEDLAGPLPQLWPGEEQGIGPNAVPARRVSYHWSRALARRAMTRLGHEPAAVPKGSSREPRWPEGLVGSITHCDAYCAAAVARSDEWRAIGIDAELIQPLADGVVARIAGAGERARLAAAADPVRATVALFSAKECVYKVWFPVTGSWLGFHDAEVELDEPRFRARLLVAPPAGAEALRELEGRFVYAGPMVVTAIALPLVSEAAAS
jgi:4'-phosphopantetheinyl transferase EntD